MQRSYLFDTVSFLSSTLLLADQNKHIFVLSVIQKRHVINIHDDMDRVNGKTGIKISMWAD